MPEVRLSPQTQEAIDRDVAPKLAGSPAAVLFTLSTLFQLVLPVLIKILQDFAAKGTTPTAANVFQAGHDLCSGTETEPAAHFDPDTRPSG